MKLGLKALKGWSVVNARSHNGCRSARLQKWLIHHDLFSAPESSETMLATKVLWPLGFVYIKAVLGLRFAVNEKSQKRYTLLLTSKRSRKVVLYASKPHTKVKINRVEPFSISFPRSVDFCFTSQKLITSDKSFYFF